MCEEFKEWEKLDYSRALIFWKNVTNVNSELDLLEKVVENFEVEHRHKNDWLSKSIRILKHGYMKLGQLSNVDDFMGYIKDKPVLLSLMKKYTIDDLVKGLKLVIKNSTSSEDLLNSSKISLKHTDMEYYNVPNSNEVTKENIKSGLLNGTFTFTHDEVPEDKCLISLKYSYKCNVIYNDMNGISNLCRQVTRSKNININEFRSSIKYIINDYDVENLEDVMNEFVGLQGTDNTINYLKHLKNELKTWKSIIDRAQESCYYLTFFSARHILAFYDYFMLEELNKENEEACKLLIRFVNNKAQLPPHAPKQMRKLETTKQHIMSDIVTNDKLFIFAYTDKTKVPNIIMLLYKELKIFVKRSVFASNDGYENCLFCIANLENYLLTLLCHQELGTFQYILDQYSLEVQDINGLDNEMMQEIYQKLCPNILCISSNLSGQGKTEWIKEASFSKNKIPRSFLISDYMNFEYLVNKIKEYKFKDIESLHAYQYFIKTFIYIEIASSAKEQLLNHIPILKFLPFKNLSWSIENLRVSQEVTSPIQVVCHYLNIYDHGEIDTKEMIKIFYPLDI
ncbi:hypothetical protein C1645_873617 [Glomus cerebriforme]|uniref:Uncharacterized protein n=1 Tax=Glomus cerebriforme TaxID=658196 RepID=A0A397TGM4_9GLOM|nr:hypothetical protein C1645_873617 [Glomus cerebriforme]